MKTRASNDAGVFVVASLTVLVGAIVGLLLAVLLVGCAPAYEQAFAIARSTPAAEARYGTDPATDHSAEFASLLERVQAVGINVEFVPATEYGGLGESFWEERTIHLDASLVGHSTQMFIVLAHEAAHILGPLFHDKAVAEAFAEAVMIGVAKHHHIDSIETSGHYLAGHKSGIPGAREYAVDIAQIVRILTNPAVTVDWGQRTPAQSAQPLTKQLK